MHTQLSRIKPHFTVINTGCSSHTMRADALLTAINPSAPIQTIGTPTGAIMKSSAAASFPILNLPKNACKAHMYPDIKYKSLMSVDQICDEGYAAVFTKDKAHIVKTDDVTTTGPVHVSGIR